MHVDREYVVLQQEWVEPYRATPWTRVKELGEMARTGEMILRTPEFSV